MSIRWPGTAGNSFKSTSWISGLSGAAMRSHTAALTSIDAVDDGRQPGIAREVMMQRQTNSNVKGLMIESHLVGGRQDIGAELVRGMSVTDACLGFEATRRLLLELAEKS